ncbi:MAG: protein kinase [Myxococcaceae bacterium]|nr:protein kinase [Myxococcaceae bacterium]
MAEEQLGRYRLLSLIATGGMGEVFLARQEGPGGFAKTVVVKRILRHLARDQGFIDLFLNEAQLAAQLQHPSIAQVYGLEREGDTWFIAMEYVPGMSLRALLDACRGRGHPVPPPLAVRLVSQVLQGLQFAHELKDEQGRALGILHRDVSPENVLVASSGMAKLVDFGIARAMRGAETRVGRPRGKLAYMAPELMVSGATVDRRADVFGAGVVLHELLTLERPPQGPVRADGTLEHRPFVPRPELPRAVNEALGKALALEPGPRWTSAGAMSEALENWLTSAGQTVLPSDVVAFLEEVSGPAGVEAAPVLLGDYVQDTGALRVPVRSVATTPLAAVTGQGTARLRGPTGQGTAPLRGATAQGTAPLPRPRVPGPELAAQAGPSGRSLLPEPAGAAPVEGTVPAGAVAAPPPTRRSGAWVALAGGATAVVFLAVSLAAMFGSRPGPPPATDPLVPPAPSLVPAVPALEPPPVAAEPVASPGPVVGEGPAPSTPLPTVERPAVKRPAPTKRAKTGRVTVRVNPWAEVYLANRSLGVTPLDPIEVPAGVATFTLKNAQLRVTRKVTVRVPPGGNVMLRADLFQ